MILYNFYITQLKNACEPVEKSATLVPIRARNYDCIARPIRLEKCNACATTWCECNVYASVFLCDLYRSTTSFGRFVWRQCFERTFLGNRGLATLANMVFDLFSIMFLLSLFPFAVTVLDAVGNFLRYFSGILVSSLCSSELTVSADWLLRGITRSTWILFTNFYQCRAYSKVVSVVSVNLSRTLTMTIIAKVALSFAEMCRARTRNAMLNFVVWVQLIGRFPYPMGWSHTQQNKTHRRLKLYIRCNGNYFECGID